MPETFQHFHVPLPDGVKWTQVEGAKFGDDNYFVFRGTVRELEELSKSIASRVEFVKGQE